MVHSQLRRALTAFALVALVSLTPASAATRAKGERRARVQSAKTQSLGIVQIVVNILTDASIRIDPNGIW